MRSSSIASVAREEFNSIDPGAPSSARHAPDPGPRGRCQLRRRQYPRRAGWRSGFGASARLGRGQRERAHRTCGTRIRARRGHRPTALTADAEHLADDEAGVEAVGDRVGAERGSDQPGGGDLISRARGRSRPRHRPGEGDDALDHVRAEARLGPLPGFLSKRSGSRPSTARRPRSGGRSLLKRRTPSVRRQSTVTRPRPASSRRAARTPCAASACCCPRGPRCWAAGHAGRRRHGRGRPDAARPGELALSAHTAPSRT